MSRKIYNVSVPNGNYTDDQGNDKTRWLNVGAVIENKNGNLNLILNAIPAPAQGQDRQSWLMNLFPVESKQGSAPPPDRVSGFDDDVPDF